MLIAVSILLTHFHRKQERQQLLKLEEASTHKSAKTHAE